MTDDSVIEGDTGTDDTGLDDTDTGDDAAPEPKPYKLEDSISDAITLLKERDATEGTEDIKPPAEAAKPRNPRRKVVSFEAQARPVPSEQRAPTAGADDNIPPPAALNADEKQWFNKAPKEARQAVARILGNAIPRVHQAMTQADRTYKEASEMLEAVKPHLQSWGMKGVSPGSAVRQLTAVNNYLIEKREEGVAQLAEAMGLDKGKLAQMLTGQQGGGEAGSNYQLPKELTKELEESRMFRERFASAVNQQNEARNYEVGRKIASEIQTLLDEQDGHGTYRYPKLHDPAYRDAMGPTWLSISNNRPEMPFRDVVRAAYQAIEGIPPPATNGAAQRPQQLQTTRSAPISVRGRGYVNGPTPIERIKGEKMDDTIRRAIELTKGNTGY